MPEPTNGKSGGPTMLPLKAGLRRQLMSAALKIDACDRQRAELVARRDALVQRALKDGVSERAIAKAAGLSGPRIHQIKENR